MLANLNAGRCRRDRRELTAHFDRRIGLGIPRLQMTHPAPAIHDDARLGFRFRASAGRRSGSQLQKRRQRQSAEAGARRQPASTALSLDRGAYYRCRCEACHLPIISPLPTARCNTKRS